MSMACGKAFCTCCREAYLDGLIAGLQVGFEVGVAVGLHVGFKRGYKRGYVDGYSDSLLGIEPPKEFQLPILETVRRRELTTDWLFNTSRKKLCGCWNGMGCCHTTLFFDE